MAPRRAQGAPPLAFDEKMRPQLSIIERKRIDLFLKKKTRVSRPELGVERVAKKNKTKQNKRNRNESFCKSNSSGRTAGAKDARDARTDSPETTTNHVKTVVLRFFLFFPRIHAWFDMATGKGSPSNKTTPLYTHTHTHTHWTHFRKEKKVNDFWKKEPLPEWKKKKRKRPHSANAQRNKNLFGRSSSSFWSSFFLPFWPQLLLTFFSENAPFFGGFFFRGPTSCCLPRSFFFSFFFFDVGNTFRSVVFFLPSFTGFLPDLLFSPGFTVICRALPSFFRDGWWWRRMIHAGAGVKRVAWTGTGV